MKGFVLCVLSRGRPASLIYHLENAASWPWHFCRGRSTSLLCREVGSARSATVLFNLYQCDQLSNLRRFYGASFVFKNRADKAVGEGRAHSEIWLFVLCENSLSDRFCKELAIWGMRAWESLTLNSFKTVLCWGGKLHDFSCMTNWIICSMVLTCLFILHTIIGVITEVQSVKSKGQRVMALNWQRESLD